MKVFDAGKTRMTGLPYGENYDDILSRFHLIPERYGRTDRQTDRFAISISRVSMLTRDKNYTIYTRLIIFVFLPFAKINKHSAVTAKGKMRCAFGQLWHFISCCARDKGTVFSHLHKYE